MAAQHVARRRRATAPVTRPGVGTAAGTQLVGWVLLCGAAEALGMTAAAGAARATDAVLTHVGTGTGALAAALGLILAAGAVEALAVGSVQARQLRRRLPDLRVRRFVVVTVVVAGLCWAAGAVPSLTSAGTAGTTDVAGPAWPLLLLAGAGLGAVTGTLLGWAQSRTLPPYARRHGTWVGASAAGWVPAMAVIMVGAGTPDVDWPLLVVLAWAALTGAVAGSLLGLVLGWFAPSVGGPRPSGRVVLALLRGGRLGSGLVGLRVRGRLTGRSYQLPVMYAEDDGVLWVAAGRSGHKTWWRNVSSGTAVQVLRDREWRSAVADLVLPQDDRHDAAAASYAARWPRAVLRPGDPFVRIEV